MKRFKNILVLTAAMFMVFGLFNPVLAEEETPVITIEEVTPTSLNLDYTSLDAFVVEFEATKDTLAERVIVFIDYLVGTIQNDTGYASQQDFEDHVEILVNFLPNDLQKLQKVKSMQNLLK